MPAQPTGVHIKIRGRVQGVGFRYFAQAAALQAGLTGWVRNCPDGDVEAEAEGPSEAVIDWIETLKKGPPLARVQSVQCDWQAPAGMYQDFSIHP